MPSDTPMTDAEEIRLGEDATSYDWIKFARELERKVAKLEREIADLGRGE